MFNLQTICDELQEAFVLHELDLLSAADLAVVVNFARCNRAPSSRTLLLVTCPLMALMRGTDVRHGAV